MPRFDSAALNRSAIHVPKNPHITVTFAAEELQRYVQRMTDVRLPLVEDTALHGRNTLLLAPIDVQAGTPAPLKAGSFRMTPETERVTLAAGSPRALLDAVYAFVAQCGCCWALHGSAEEIVPRLGAAVELTPIEHEPRFAVSGYSTDIMTWHYTQPEHFNDRLDDDRAFIDWMGKSGANVFSFIRHPFDTQLTIPDLLPEFLKRGIDVEYGGHVMPLLLPRELYAKHPDYFPQTPDGTRTDHGNLCTGNADALAIASTNAVQYVREYPEMSAIHIWGADLWQGGWCHCGQCGALSVQDQSLRVCNAVARGLEAAGVARPVCYLAYHDTIEPQLTLHPDDHVLVEFAPRERCYGHALNDPECTTNRRYATALERYVDLFNGRVRLFEYYGDAILFFGCAVPLTQVIAADVDYFRRLGIPGITMLQFGLFSQWAYPLNFLAFAGLTPESYCARFDIHARTAVAAFAELESIMRHIVTYGDIRRPPRSAEHAARILARVNAALPRLDALADRLEVLPDDTLQAQAALARYTHAVLAAVREQLGHTTAGTSGSADEHYTAALEIMNTVERRFKGVWGAVDLPMIHSFYTAAAFTTVLSPE